jgi:glycosyltransferase involved in cell wall biosynthesis
MFKQFVQPIIDKSPFKSEIHSIGYVPDEELSYLLSGAQCFLYLSKMEGFGYAPLEAMACGVPVICSKNTSMIENLSDNVYWVNDSDSAEKIANKIIIISNNSRLSENLIKRGLRRASEFNEHRFQIGMKNVYLRIAKNNLEKLRII